MNGRRKRKTLAGRDQWYAGSYRKEDSQSKSLGTATHIRNKSSAARVRGATARPEEGKQGIVWLDQVGRRPKGKACNHMRRRLVIASSIEVTGEKPNIRDYRDAGRG